VVAYLALFVALGGTSFAALKIGSAEIRDNSVRGKDVRNNSLTGRDVNERGLRALPSAYQRTRLTSAPRGGSTTNQVDCKRGDVALSGSYSVLSGPTNEPGVRVSDIGLVSEGGGRGTPIGYRVFLGLEASASGDRRDLEVRVLCARRPGR
jgi:hypothetical protein